MADARRFVAETYGERATILHALGAGAWSQAYAFTLDGQPAVVRFGHYVDDFRKDQAMAAHSCPALPVPAVTEIGRAEIGPAGIGAVYFAVSERAPGRILNDLDAAGLRCPPRPAHGARRR